MHDIKWIRDNAAAFDEALRNRQISNEDLKRYSSQNLLALDDRRREAIVTAEAAQAKRNALSKEIGQAKAKKDEARAAELMAQVNAIKESLPKQDEERARIEKELNDLLAEIPNTPFTEAEDGPPVGADEGGNREYRRHKAPPNFAFDPKEHYELGEALGGMDFETAAKLSGSRFVVMKQGVARLHRALGQFMLDTHTLEHGYTECNPPLLVKDETAYGTANLPKFAEDLFRIPRMDEHSYRSYAKALLAFRNVKFPSGEAADLRALAKEHGPAAERAFREFESAEDPQSELYALEKFAREIIVSSQPDKSALWLIPTAEVSLTNFVRDSIVTEDQLPMRLTALTPCFRSEAGSAGRDTRGMLRQHQFEKVELVSITAPDKSREEHERMLWAAENVLKKLDLPFRVMTLCTGDMGFASKKTYDIEVWLPGQKNYREISSCSVCGDFQARRMKAQYRNKAGKVDGFVHTLNGSGVAVGRALIAVMENYQDENGAIHIPDALRPYMGGATKIEKAA